MKQAKPNFTEFKFIRQLRNAFVYSLGLFTQLSVTKIKLYQFTAQKAPIASILQRRRQHLLYFYFAQMKPFSWGVALCVFCGSVKIEMKQAKPDFTEYKYKRQFRNAFVYSLGLFTQLTMKKIKLYQFTAQKAPIASILQRRRQHLLYF